MKRLAVMLFATCITSAHAQSPWQGEWGTFTDAPTRRLTLSDCTTSTCRFYLTVKGNGSSCSTLDGDDSPKLTLLSDTDASVLLPGETNTQSCKLQMHRSATPPGITIIASGDACRSYYCTGAGSGFNQTFPLRSATLYAGSHAEACFSNTTPAIRATCADPAVAKLEEQWQSLYTDYPLTPAANKDQAGYTHMTIVDDAILKQCDTATNPAACLHDRYSTDIATMQAHKTAAEDASTERGDPAIGGPLARKIAGRYRHSFANGDVQGDNYRSTDTLTITAVGAASIHFDTELNFYNGHTCSLSGGALFRKDGSFVFDDDPANALPPAPACRLAIIPSADGVSFKDLNGSCKDYCGARGSWDNAGFSFSQRTTSATHK